MSDIPIIWLKNNHLKAINEKCHLLLSSKTPNKSLLGCCSIKPTQETLLAVLIDSELHFH